MFGAKIDVVTVVALLFTFLQPGIKAHLTIDSSGDDSTCSQLKEELTFKVEENMRMRNELKSER